MRRSRGMKYCRILTNARWLIGSFARLKYADIKKLPEASGVIAAGGWPSSGHLRIATLLSGEAAGPRRPACALSEEQSLGAGQATENRGVEAPKGGADLAC